MTSQLEIAYDYCQRVARKQAKNFYYAFRTLPTPKRRAIYATYAFCRMCDDIADEDMPIDEKRRQFSETRNLLTESLRRTGSEVGNDALPPEFAALSDATAAFGIPHHYYTQVIEGVESDLVKTRFENFEELKAYCYQVASVVGLICIEVFGYEDEAAREYAIDMGIAMQLTNILRDIKEDAERDRIYIPLDEMARFGYSEDDLKQGIIDERFRSLMALQVNRARDYYQRSQKLFPLIDAGARACPKVLHLAYRSILDRIDAQGYDVFSQRIGLSTFEKLMITGRLWAGTLLPSGPSLRR
ncbi:MAG: phytoene/squalene synthase family protein [Dehalococcoidia bacterium]